MKRQIVFIMMAIALVLTNGAYASERVEGVSPSIRGLEARDTSGDANEPVELEDYLTFAALNNAGLQVAFEQWKIAV
jgi:hypothetical protein